MSLTPQEDIDMRALARWLGPEGARAGLEKSKICTVDILRRIAEKLGMSIPTKNVNRQQLIEDIVQFANRRIDKPISELVRLQEEELITYFEKADPDRQELLDLLKDIDAAPTRESKKDLMRFAARELSETGRFMRIAGTNADAQPSHEQEKSKT